MPDAKNPLFYEFADFRADAEKRVLWRGSEQISLTPKVFETLLVFLEHHGEVLDKDELMSLLWADSFVEESNLTQNVAVLRRVLGENPKQHKYILTIPGRGYRFVAEVRKLSANGNGNAGLPPYAHFAETEQTTQPVGPQVLPQPARVTRSRKALMLFGTAGLFVAIAGLAIYVVTIRKSPSTEAISIPVLRGTKNEDAYRYYLNALNLMGRVSLPVAQEAVESLEEAIRLDPGFARAYAGLARGRVELSNLVDDPKPDCEKAWIAIEQALVLDAALAEAFQASGIRKLRCEWDFAGAESDLHRALVLDPRSDSTHWAYAAYLNSVGRSDEAIAEIEKAISLNPNSVSYNIQRGIILYCARRYDDSIAALRHADEIGHLAAAQGWLWTAYVQKGDDAQAFEWFLKLETEKQLKPDPGKIEQLEQIYETAGWKGIREMQLETEMASPVYKKGRFYRISRLSVQLGETDDAFRYLNMALERRDAQLLLLKSEPTFDPLRSDPRFAEILTRIGFPPDS